MSDGVRRIGVHRLDGEVDMSGRATAGARQRKVASRKKKADSWQKQAVAYWSRKVDESSIGCDFDEADVRCWRCGYLRKCQKCHIVPKSLGGPDSVSNIIPLCADCHDEMPNVADPAEVWAWIARDHGNMYETYWVMRAIAMSGVSQDQMASFDKDMVPKLMDQCGLHFGQMAGRCRLTPATLAWAIRKACEQ
jgi:hypothetical protein